MARQINVGLSNTIGQFINKTNTMSGYLGDLDNLTTTVDSSIVGAINSLKTALDSSTAANPAGALSSQVAALDSSIGTLATLDTTNKSSIVAAINELDDRIDSASDFQSYFSAGANINVTGGVISHTTQAQANSGNANTLASAESFSAVTTLGINSTGHVTGVNTITFTLPTSLDSNAATLLIDSSYVAARIPSGGGAVTQILTDSSLLKLYTNSGTTLNTTWDSDDMIVQGNITSLSDITHKENIRTINEGLSIVEKLRGVRYNKKGSALEQIGVIAQEIEEILPEVVLTGDNGIKSVAYGNIVGVLIEAVKELKTEIDQLKDRN